MPKPTYAPPLENYPRPRPLVINKTPCRTGVFLAFIVLATAVIGVDRYLTNDALRRVDDFESWHAERMAQIKTVNDAQNRMMYSVRVNEVLAGQVKVLQSRLDEAETVGAQLMLENMTLKGFYPPADTTGPTVITPPDRDT